MPGSWNPFKAATKEFVQILIASILVGAITGTVMQIFLKSFFILQNWSFSMFVKNPIYIIILPLIGALITSLILHNKYLKPGHGWGPGPDVLIKDFHNDKKTGQSHWTAGIVKFFAQLFGVGMGNSGGLVGPAARIGQGLISPLMPYLDKIGIDRRQLAVMAMAGGIAGLLRTPVGAGVFVTELLHAGERIPKKYAIGGELSCMTAAATSFIAFDANPFFGYLPYTLEVSHLWWFAVLGFLAGITALIFIKTFQFSVKFFENLNVPVYVKPLIGSIIPAALAFVLLTIPIGDSGNSILTSFDKAATGENFLILGYYGDPNDPSRIAGTDPEGNTLYIKDEFSDELPYTHSTPTYLGFGADNVRMSKAAEYDPQTGLVTMMIASQLEPAIGADGKQIEKNGMKGYINGLKLPILAAVGLLLLIMFGKIFANSWYVSSFASGGMVMPAMIVGSLMGGAFALTLASIGFVEPSNSGGYVVVGALSVLAAMTNAPIGCAIFALVIFGVPFAVPALIGTMVAYQIAKFETIYETAATIEKIMHKPVFVEPTITVLKSAEIMAEKGISSVLIKDKGKIKVFTERDILKKITAGNKDPARIKVSEIAVEATCKVGNTATIEDAVNILEKHHIRHLPVVEKDKDEDAIIGIVTSRDIAEAPFSYFQISKIGKSGAVKVKEITRSIVVADPKMSVLDAARIMAEKDVGSSIFIQSGSLHGIVTERDFITKVVAKNLSPEDVRIIDVASGLTITINAKETIKDAIRIFEDSHVRHLPVMEKGEIIGIITTRDVANVISAE